MKKIALALFIAATTITANAQNIRFGVKGGINISRESQNEAIAQYTSTDISYRIGFHAGAVASMDLSNKWELEADLLYSMQGYEDKIYTTALEQNLHDENYKVTSHYINLPVAVKFYPVKVFYVEAGPQVGYLLSKKGKLEDWDGEDSFDNTKKIDFSIFAGVGYFITENIFVNARYIHGLTGTSKDYDGAKNRNFQISFGYMF